MTKLSIPQQKGVDVVATARSLINTPYLHQGRVPGVGLDCIGLPIVVCRKLGLGEFDCINYSRNPDGTLCDRIAQVCEELPKIKLGSLLVFRISNYPQHCAIATDFRDDLGMIHAWDVAGKVWEHRLAKSWEDKLVAVYALPGVNYV